MDLNAQLKKYAELIVRVGGNVQPGQPVFLIGAVEIAELVRLVAEQAYEAGASNVHVDWTDETITRLKYEKAADEVFTRFPEWETAKRNDFVNQNGVYIAILSPNPDLLKGIPSERIANFQKAQGHGLREFRRATQADRISWTLVAASTRAWAAKVFPGESEEEAVAKLWEAIFKAVRLDSSDPVQAWERHNRHLHAKSDWLNEKRFVKLLYRAPGTELTVELPEKHLWVAASSVNAQGTPFMANMPTEEVFTVPNKTGVNGYVSSTKPLSYGGNIIDGFKLTFEAGRIVKVEAKQGQDILQNLVDSDEGSHYLGEVALVPNESPISQSNVLFLNTLFDENASNHFAIGNGYAFNVEGGKEMTPEELIACGVNSSIAHVDFMVGSAEMDIDGVTADGTAVPVFRKGNWSF
ncbi:MAG: aminopeptidase [Cohnella sp.]|nr:aminopeptidase [Cohnella sp.]